MSLYRISTSDWNFSEKVDQMSGEKIMNCIQCGECTSSCPIAFAMDLMPNQVMRMVQLGIKEEVLKSSTIWLCASCLTCSARCPRDIDIAKVMDALRETCLKENLLSKEVNISEFHKTFMGVLKSDGRLNELKLIMLHKLKTKRFFEDVILGIKMFLKQKINPFVKGVTDKKEIQKIFQMSEELKGDKR